MEDQHNGNYLDSDEEQNGGVDLFSDPNEMKVIHNVLNSFFHYRAQAHFHFTHKRRQAFYAMPQRHWQLLAEPPFNILSTFEDIDDAIDKNANIAEAFLETGLAFAGLDATSPEQNASFLPGGKHLSSKPEWQGRVIPADQEKAHHTIRQLYREWSAEGQPERDACYGTVVRALDEEFGDIPEDEKGTVKILVPGAGLGRSIFEMVKRGYTVEGNEISYHQIIASAHILNATTKAGQYELYPWIGESSNHLSRADQLQCVLIPNVHPATALSAPSTGSMSFSSADFCVEYNKKMYAGAYNAVTTIFFIDTAPNFIRYLETVHNCLTEGGIWINLGPLKWHFESNPPGGSNKDDSASMESSVESRDAGIAEPGAIELTNEEVVSLVEQFGFVIERQEVLSIETAYVGNPQSMWRGTYHPSFWVAKKQ